MNTDRIPFVSMRRITKRFPGVVALDDVDIHVCRGEVVALVGENGAGKSTLMKILSGVYAEDDGDIMIEGEPARIRGTLSSIKFGISTIYQELSLIPNLSITENLFLGREQKKRGFVDTKGMNRQAAKYIEAVGMDIDPVTPVMFLSTAQRQMIEVAKALSFDAKLIIMDEPTSSLTDSETNMLLKIIKDLKTQNVGVIFITHRMNEIFQVADRIAVMRDGKMVSNLDVGSTNKAEIIEHMVGREVNDIFAKEEAEITDVVLEVENLSTKSFLKNINFNLKKGEILGFAGLVGAGRSEVMRAIFGVDPKTSGVIRVDGKEVKINSTVDALKNKIGFLPEDRKEQALVLNMTVRENLTLACLENVSRLHFINPLREKQLTGEYVERFRIKTPGIEQTVVNLSGGNQQKVVIGKWVATDSHVLILDEPTRGIDVGTKKEIHALMSRLAQQGVGIIMISSELPEILGMADRIVVMHEGQIKGELLREEASQERIMSMAISQHE